ncbi:hypothetical protein J6590_002417 [Homalodisca vitripennis]|nr:hypothetical protein J6590_002417 [Homalodisca vitripennis]
MIENSNSTVSNLGRTIDKLDCVPGGNFTKAVLEGLWPTKTPLTVWPCPSCAKVYRSKTSLSLHQRVECGKEPRHSCPYCMRKFYHASSMNRHVRVIHRDLLPQSQELP